ncbi:hypothetical protein acdb102_44780 [Acidothermaceae bacterium B102]|nr:hypothetical protein acdb102_44780 [Acidothermaceae bacterium B102]
MAAAAALVAAAAALVAAAALDVVVAEPLLELLPHAAMDMAETSPTAASLAARCARTEIPFPRARPRGRDPGADHDTLDPPGTQPKGRW